MHDLKIKMKGLYYTKCLLKFWAHNLNILVTLKLEIIVLWNSVGTYKNVYKRQREYFHCILAYKIFCSAIQKYIQLVTKDAQLLHVSQTNETREDMHILIAHG